MDHTNQNITVILHSAAKQMKRLTPHLKMKKSEPCPHTFKCANCQEDHQADSNQCLFWKHHLNCE